VIRVVHRDLVPVRRPRPALQPDGQKPRRLTPAWHLDGRDTGVGQRAGRLPPDAPQVRREGHPVADEEHLTAVLAFFNGEAPARCRDWPATATVTARGSRSGPTVRTRGWDPSLATAGTPRGLSHGTATPATSSGMPPYRRPADRHPHARRARRRLTRHVRPVRHSHRRHRRRPDAARVTSGSTLDELPTAAATRRPSVQYTRLGSSGLKVSRIALGCMSFGTFPGASTSGPSATTRRSRSSGRPSSSASPSGTPPTSTGTAAPRRSSAAPSPGWAPTTSTSTRSTASTPTRRSRRPWRRCTTS
jgi:hypothetical protein